MPVLHARMLEGGSPDLVPERDGPLHHGSHQYFLRTLALRLDRSAVLALLAALRCFRRELVLGRYLPLGSKRTKVRIP